MTDWWTLSVFAGYFAVLLGIAVIRVRPVRTMSDYVLAGRRMGIFTSAMSVGSSTTSGWTFLALPALAFASGTVVGWTLLSLVVFIWINWVVVAKRLRRYTIAAGDSLTLPDFFEKRFGDTTGTLRAVASLITVFFVIFYVSSGLVSGAKLLENVFGLDETIGVLVTLAAVASYTFIGGFLAVSRTDAFQAILMLAGLIILPTTLIIAASAPFESGSGAPGFMNPFTEADNEPIGFVVLATALGWGLGAFGAQRVLQRFMAIDSEESIPRSRNASVVWIFLMYGFAILLGLVAGSALAEKGLLDSIADPERIFLVTSEAFFYPLVTGLLMTALIAAVMSTADSQLLLASAVASDDMPFTSRLARAVSASARVWLGRLLLLIIGAIAAAMSIYQPDSVLNLVSYAWGGMGAAFGPLILMALFWRRFNFWGALTAMIVGTVAASVWGTFDGGPGGIWDIHPATPGFAIGAPAAILATLLTPRPSDEVVALFDEVRAGRYVQALRIIRHNRPDTA